MTTNDTQPDPGYFDVTCNQRAYRELLPDPVPEALIEKILTAGTHAPSARNLQPWHFVVVQDEDVRREIAGGTRAAWEGFAKGSIEDQTTPIFKEVDRWAMGGLAEAPVIIVVCGNTLIVGMEEMGSSIYPAAQNILLAASALGLGSLMSSLPIFAPDGAFAKILGLPEHIVPLATLPIGYPARKLGRPRRRPIAELTSRDHFDSSW
ncbi:MAG: nitroreductase [bacterium]|nr:nitroreductase [Deltaproteobacteria bacterium]MCP4908553.1 nitroreductase [bacterium]